MASVSAFAALALPLAAGQLCILRPASVRAQYMDGETEGCILGATATFAAPGLGDRIRGRLRLWPGYGCEVDELSPSALRSAGDVYIVRRGHCSFAVKAEHASNLGASALVVMDFPESQQSDAQVALTVVAGGADSPGELVPTVLIGSSAAAQLTAALAEGLDVDVELRWGQPRRRAVLDLWLPSAGTGASDATALLRDLAPTAKALQEALLIRPHARVVTAAPNTPRAGITRHCFAALPQLCSPVVSDALLSTQGSGAVSLEEAVRQHCILALHTNGQGPSSSKWWSYVEYVANNCMQSSGGLELQPGCSNRAMAALDMGAGALAAVRRCEAEQGLSFLEDDREAAVWGAPDQVAVRINDWRYSGPAEAGPILRALCRGLSWKSEACKPFLPAEKVLEEPGIRLWALVGLCCLALIAGQLLRGSIAWSLLRCWRKAGRGWKQA
eukprot:TRINITY_DN93612_c0_g1_i1.p1 TRINITY_DN93612_c0_g1~~TRINITY_DN93612_c0_g1_i1.p1  ORF type:complete len:444 (-),score=70.96 TRINITY_DN93612_c0_g1_i1:38-1369(-)